MPELPISDQTFNPLASTLPEGITELDDGSARQKATVDFYVVHHG